jgi:transcriptional regulator with XRE-family HTH domain
MNIPHEFMSEVLLTLGKRIAELRSKRGFSQESFADECGLHRTAIGLLERGKSIPRLDTLLILSHGLGINISQLLSKVSTKDWPRKGLNDSLGL